MVRNWNGILASQWAPENFVPWGCTSLLLQSRPAYVCGCTQIGIVCHSFTGSIHRQGSYCCLCQQNHHPSWVEVPGTRPWSPLHWLCPLSLSPIHCRRTWSHYLHGPQAIGQYIQVPSQRLCMHRPNSAMPSGCPLQSTLGVLGKTTQLTFYPAMLHHSRKSPQHGRKSLRSWKNLLVSALLPIYWSHLIWLFDPGNIEGCPSHPA